MAAAADCGIQLSELDAVLAPLRSSCTKDNMQSAKSWVLINITDSASSEFFSVYLIDRSVQHRSMKVVYYPWEGGGGGK